MNRRQLCIGLTATATAGCGFLSRGKGPDMPTTLKPSDPDGRVRVRPTTAPAKKNGDARSKDPGGELFEITMPFDGHERKAIMVVPEGDGSPRPLIIASHGNGEGPETMYRGNRWQGTAVRKNVLMVFPETGNAAGGGQAALDDTAFLAALLRWTMSEYSVKEDRVYGVGFSGGCRRIYWLAARHANLLAAIGVASGKIGHESDDPHLWNPSANNMPPMSVLHIHGEKDTRVPINGGPYTPADGVERQVFPMSHAIKTWANHNNAKKWRDAPRPPKCPSSTNYEVYRSESRHMVVGIRDPNLPHKWAREYANQTIMEFFSRVPTR